MQQHYHGKMLKYLIYTYILIFSIIAI